MAFLAAQHRDAAPRFTFKAGSTRTELARELFTIERAGVRIPEVQGKWFYSFTDADFTKLGITGKTFKRWIRTVHTDGRKSTAPTLGRADW
jgi:hypothetical protein